MPTCRVITCRAASCPSKNISLHVFPRHEPERSAWIEFCDRPPVDGVPWEPNKVEASRDRVCSQHFTADCYEIVFRDGNTARTALKRGAIPSINKCPENKRTPAPKRQSCGKSEAAVIPAKKVCISRRRCSVPNCKSLSDQNNKSHHRIRFHKFPRDPEVGHEWRHLVNNPRLSCLPLSTIENKKLVVCSLHFQDICYSPPEWRHQETTKLVWNALPTLQLNLRQNDMGPLYSRSLRRREAHDNSLGFLQSGTSCITERPAIINAKSIAVGLKSEDDPSDLSQFLTASDETRKTPESCSGSSDLPSLLSPELGEGSTAGEALGSSAGGRLAQEYALHHVIASTALKMDAANNIMLNELSDLRKRQLRSRQFLISLVQQLSTAVNSQAAKKEVS